MVIDSRLEEAAQARAWLAKRASQAGIPPDAIGDLKLVLTEAVTNVVRHAYGGEPGHEIVLSLSTDAEALTLTIRDFGRQFDTNRYQAPDLSEPQEGGYGVFLMHSLMDEVRYDTPEEGTILTLVRRRVRTPSTSSGRGPSTSSGQGPSTSSGQGPSPMSA